MSNKEKRTIYITHSGELLFWLVVILFLLIFSFFTHKNIHASKNYYKILMPDVDGMIVGSPVKAMGTEIGHVVKIEPTNDEVYVKFILDDKNLILPQGTLATVEFSGMAGSKSLELYLPDKNTYIEKDTPMLEVLPPTRLSDASILLKDMFSKITSIIEHSTYFIKKLPLTEPDNIENKENIKIEVQSLKEFDNEIDNITTKLNEINKKIKR